MWPELGELAAPGMEGQLLGSGLMSNLNKKTFHNKKQLFFKQSNPFMRPQGFETSTSQGTMKEPPWVPSTFSGIGRHPACPTFTAPLWEESSDECKGRSNTSDEKSVPLVPDERRNQSNAKLHKGNNIAGKPIDVTEPPL